jgi:hypothetical protein
LQSFLVKSIAVVWAFAVAAATTNDIHVIIFFTFFDFLDWLMIENEKYSQTNVASMLRSGNTILVLIKF